LLESCRPHRPDIPVSFAVRSCGQQPYCPNLTPGVQSRISAAGLQVRPYFHRYTEDALDLCDVFGSYSPGAKVDEICKIIGLPGKPSGIDGGEVEAMVQAGRIAEVAQYCESDVLNTYRLWLVYELFRGAITAEQLAFSETQAADFVRNRKSDTPRGECGCHRSR